MDRYRDLPYGPYDPNDPENAPLTEEEQRLDEIQTRGLRERQADQERAGHRFDILGDDWGPTRTPETPPLAGGLGTARPRFTGAGWTTGWA